MKRRERFLGLLAGLLLGCGASEPSFFSTDDGPVINLASETSPWGTGDGSGTWTYRNLAPVSGPDYEIETTLRVEQGTFDDAPIHEHDRVANYRAGEALPGYEAGLVLRQGEGGFYRIQISTLWQEAALWSSKGGFLQVRSFPFVQGQSYRLIARVSGTHLTLQVDGTQILDYYDTTAPIVGTAFGNAKGGSAALARKEGTTHFDIATVRKVAKETAKPPVHTANFRLRKWKGIRWGFDGDEPIFAIGVPDAQAAAMLPYRVDSVVYEMKLVPGYMPQLYLPWFMQNFSSEQFELSHLQSVEVKEQGSRLVLVLTNTDEYKRPDLLGQTTVTLTYDPTTNVYVYDHVSALTIPQGRTLLVDALIDITDVGIYNGVAAGSPKGQDWPVPHPYSVYQHESGVLYQEPHNHMGWYPGWGTAAWYKERAGYLKPDGGFWSFVGDPVANPVLRLEEPASRKEFQSLLCGTALDLHFGWFPQQNSGSLIPAGTYKVHWVITSVPGPQGDAWLKNAGFATPGDLNAKWLLYSGGVGHVDRFDRVVQQASPFGEFPWGTGAIHDGSVGRGDHSSLRLQGPNLAQAAAGDARFTESVEPNSEYQVSVWVKTKDVVGEGPGLVIAGKPYYPGIRGTTDWQEIGLVFSTSDDVYEVPFTLHNSGAGTVWFDDFELRRVTPGKPAGSGPYISRSTRSLSQLTPPKADSELHLAAASDQGDTALDLSGHGHHGALRNVRFVPEGSSKSLHFDGSGQLVVRGHPSLAFSKQVTLSLWIKPGTQKGSWGMVASSGPKEDYDEWRVVLLETGFQMMQLDLQMRTGRFYSPTRIIPKDQWSHLAITHDGTVARAYLDGMIIGEIADAATWLKGAENGYLRFGAGSQENGFYANYTGAMANLRIAPKVLSPSEIAAQVAAGPFAP